VRPDTASEWDASAAAGAVAGPFTDRDCRLVFVFSSMTVVDELRRSSKDAQRYVHTALTFTDFLEAVARLADSNACPILLPEGLRGQAGPLLHEWGCAPTHVDPSDSMSQSRRVSQSSGAGSKKRG